MKRKLISLFAIVALIAIGTIGSVQRASADEHEMSAPHPAHIHVGTCEAPGEIVAPLSEVTGDYLVDGTPTAGDALMGPASALPVEASITTVPIALADIVAGGHTIVVHESAEEIGTYIVCGDIGGVMLGASDLAIGLGELNESGEGGIAWLHDNGDSTTTVSVFLTDIHSGHEEDDDSHESEAVVVEGTQVDVTLNEYTITTSMPTLKVGETYTFVATNTGSIEHEMVIEMAGAVDEPLEMDGKELEIEGIGPGETGALTMSFDTPGMYQLSCHVPDHFEAGMVMEFEVIA